MKKNERAMWRTGTNERSDGREKTNTQETQTQEYFDPTQSNLQTPQVNPGLLQSNLQPSISQTGLTPSEQALLSEEEKAIRLRQRGMA